MVIKKKAYLKKKNLTFPNFSVYWKATEIKSVLSQNDQCIDWCNGMKSGTEPVQGKRHTQTFTEKAQSSQQRVLLKIKYKHPKEWT